MEDDQLLKEKYPQGDLFICDVADAVIKDIMPQMEHPFYTLSKNPVTSIRLYRHGERWIKITPSVQGLATIYDKDILIYAISQIIAKLNRGEKVSKRVRINTYELLRFTNRGTGGKDYKAFEQSLERLRGTTISTNVITGGIEQVDVFGLIESGTIRRKFGFDGRLLSVDIVLSDWVFNAIEKKEVLTLNRDYFRLRKPIERRIYELARKHCGQKNQFVIGLSILHKKSGSQANLKEFRRNIKKISETNHLPDYTVDIDFGSDQVIFRNRAEWWESGQNPPPQIKNTETYQLAKMIIPDAVDVYDVEQQWLEHWQNTGRPEINNPDKAFLGFVAKKYAQYDD